MEALVLWEVSKKQQYIFSSNKLKENRGASIVIEDIVEKMPYSIDENYKKDLVYNGGGSSLYKFESRIKAKEFIRNVSEKGLRNYPGVELFMVIQEYDKGKDKVTEAINNAYRKLAIKKNRRKNRGGELSFGIERICESTGLPASFREKEDGTTRYISSEIRVKKNKSEKNNKRFDHLLPVEDSIREFNDLSNGDKNYLAVVHIDGNQMGVKLQMLKDGFTYEGNNIEEVNRQYLVALERFSSDIKEAYESSFKHMAKEIYKNKDKLGDISKIDDEKFPLIPIIIAGDDITYVTNGKIGIESARLFIEHLNTCKININGKDISLNACAGVTIAKIGHQFYKSYELAEDLCNNAKKKVLNDYFKTGEDYSLIDWHIEQSDLVGGISDIRESYYKTLDDKMLNMRPLYLNNSKKWTNYSNFKKAYRYLTEHQIKGQGLARNKLKKLRNILRKGENETEIYIKSNNIYFYFPALDGTRGDYCFSTEDNICMYYDAIEAIDMFIELE